MSNLLPKQYSGTKCEFCNYTRNELNRSGKWCAHFRKKPGILPCDHFSLYGIHTALSRKLSLGRDLVQLSFARKGSQRYLHFKQSEGGEYFKYGEIYNKNEGLFK